MKRIVLFSITLICIFNSMLQAQSLEFGVSVGAGNPSVEWPENTYFYRGEYTFKTRIHAGAELSWVSKSGFGARGGLLYLSRTAVSDSVNIFPSRPLEYHSEVEANISTLFIPLQVCYRIPFGKLYAQFSAGVFPGFQFNAEVKENLIIKTNFPDIDEPAKLDYEESFEIGIIGEARLAYQLNPKVGVGANVLYFRSELDIGLTPDGGARKNLIDQYSKGLLFSLSVHLAL